MRRMTRANLRPTLWLLALLLVAWQTLSTAHEAQHLGPALAVAGDAHHAPDESAIGHDELSLSCDLCAAGHLTLISQTLWPAPAPLPPHWLAPEPEQGGFLTPLPCCCRGPPRHA